MNASDWRNRAALAEERLSKVREENEALKKRVKELEEKPPIPVPPPQIVTKKATKKKATSKAKDK